MAKSSRTPNAQSVLDLGIPAQNGVDEAGEIFSPVRSMISLIRRIRNGLLAKSEPAVDFRILGREQNSPD